MKFKSLFQKKYGYLQEQNPNNYSNKSIIKYEYD